jgi:predicted AlkP superfamily pyrophosphatase or phosphodiesterase
MKSTSLRLLFFAFLSFVPALHAADSPGGRVRKTLVIGIDGCRVDCLTKKAAPALSELADGGRFAVQAYAGGPLGTKAEQPTVSGPGWCTILTGVWVDKHGVRGNDFKANNLSPDKYPHFFYRLKGEVPALRLASSTGWDAIENHIVSPVKDSFAFRFKGDGSGDHHEKGDAQVQEQLKKRLTGENDDLLFVHYDQCDGAGHKYGFGPKIPQYLQAIGSVDKLVAEDVALIKARKSYANEDWLILVTTDHGGEGRNHGAQSELCRTIFVIANGPGIEARKIRSPVSQSCIAPTVADWFSIPVKPAWGWETSSFLK